MYGFPKKTYAEIFSMMDQLAAWQHILGSYIELYQKITNPFRSDTHANCYLREYQGVLWFTDHAYKEFNKYTCVHAWSRIYGVSLMSAAEMIYHHQFIKALSQRPQICMSTDEKVSRPGANSVIHFEPYLYKDKPTFTELDKMFWSRRNVSAKDLTDDPITPVYSVHHYYVNGVLFYPLTYPCYALHFTESQHTKLYCPNNPKDLRFPASTATSEDVWQWVSPINDTAIITKSYKDGKLLSKLVPDADIYAFQSEGVIPKEKLNVFNQYKHNVILYDNDNAGIEAAKTLKTHIPNSSTITYPTTVNNRAIKDTDDLVVNNQSAFVVNFIQNHLEHVLS